MDITTVVLALGAALFYGSALVMAPAGLRHLGPLQGACISIPTACVMFVVLSPLTIDWTAWDARSAGLFALIGCLFPATATLLTFNANRRIGPNLTGALGNLAPLFAVVLAVLVLGESLTVGEVVAIAIILGGVVLLYRAPRTNVVESAGWAFALPIVAAIIRGLVQPMTKLGLEGWGDPFAAVTIGYVMSTLVVLASSAIMKRGWPVRYHRTGWLWFGLVGVCNGLAVLTMYGALALGTVTIVAPLVACYPLATLAVGRVVLGKAGLTRHTLLGVAVVVGGVVLLLVV
jgi:drug/metabolite transporter (DMT)-like permease